MDFRTHFVITGSAIRNWFIGQLQDALVVAALWLLGLVLLHVPLWFVWVSLAFVFQFIPQFGPVLSVIGPAASAVISGGWERLLYVLILYAVVVVLDGLVLQPLIMRRTAKVPIWASIVVPIALAIPFGFWGLLLAPPLLAVLFSYLRRRKQNPAIEIIPPPRRTRMRP